MPTTITLSRALKEKNRLAGDLKRVQSLIATHNVVFLDAGERKFNIATLDVEMFELRSKLIELKAQITVANARIATQLVHMSELKGEVEFWKDLSTDDSPLHFPVVYGDARPPRARNATIDAVAALNRVKEGEHTIARLQDEIDAFNATTHIELSFNV